MINILSLGAGVQSTTLLLMSCRGLLPKINHAIFADTQWEPRAVYEHLEWLKVEAAAAGIPIHTVTRGNLRQDAIEFRQHRKSADGKRYASIPLHVLNADGSGGIIRRQCTSEYKIEPIDRFIRRDILGLKPRQRAPKEHVIDQWFGISRDEMQRVRICQDGWRDFVYPFIKTPALPGGYLEKSFTRADCVAWLEQNYPDHSYAAKKKRLLIAMTNLVKEWSEKYSIEMTDRQRFDLETALRVMNRK